MDLKLKRRRNIPSKNLIILVIFFLLVLSIGIGYASVKTTLEMDGNIKFDKDVKMTADKVMDDLDLNPNPKPPSSWGSSTTDEGLFAAQDDYGTSYYYRGASEKNYVYFAGFYWRIIRFNGDGSMRMIYDGKQAYANGVSNTDRFALTSVKWNNYCNNIKYGGYMFGGADGVSTTSVADGQKNETESVIKKQLEAWYETNIQNKNYSKYVDDKIFCNDRTLFNDNVKFGAYIRTVDTTTYNLKCPQDNDKFTVSAPEGNKKLKYPVGLITGDEMAFAGARYGISNSAFYLYKGSKYWTMSPSFVYNGSTMQLLVTTGTDHDIQTNSSMPVAPVINIKADYVVTMTGTGERTNPYKIA